MTNQQFVYILLCADGKFYTGTTKDLPDRLHKYMKTGSTSEMPDNYRIASRLIVF